jgi:hypothetical protein
MDSTMPVIYQKMYFREDARRNPNVLYLFGDNERRTGLGGQAAELRGEPNAVGIRTKRAPGRNNEDYWSDKTFDSNCAKLEEDLSRVKSHLRRGGIIVIPADGIGTNRADMEKRCPKTFYVLQQTLASLENIPVTV